MRCPLRVQTLNNLAQDYHRSIPWIRSKILDYEPPELTFNPRPVVIVCDATFYGKRKDGVPPEGITWEL
jgi:hypothetical protein